MNLYIKYCKSKLMKSFIYKYVKIKVMYIKIFKPMLYILKIDLFFKNIFQLVINIKLDYYYLNHNYYLHNVFS